MARYEDYRALREQGMTYQEIADRYHVSRQAVYGSLTRQRAERGRGRYPNKVVYPAIRNWLADQQTTIKELEGKIQHPLYGGLHGGTLTKDTIDALLVETGLSYEEAFRRE